LYFIIHYKYRISNPFY